MTPPAHNQSQPPAPIAQLAWLLHSILSQEPEGNDSILHALTMASSASSEMAPLTSDSLNHEGLAFLSGHWAILANIQYLLNEVLRLLSFATATALRIQFWELGWRAAPQMQVTGNFDQYDLRPALASSKEAPRQRGVCVNHLKRCKTSKIAMFQFIKSLFVLSDCAGGSSKDHLGPLPTKNPRLLPGGVRHLKK